MRSVTLQNISTYVLSFLLCLAVSFSNGVKAQTDAADGAAAEATAGAATAATDAAPADNAAVEAGKALFENNCTTCHAVNDEVVVGPGMKGINERRPQAWLISWIRNSSKMVQSGDAYSVEIFNKYNKTQMPSFAFSDDEIKSILTYIKAAENQAPAQASVAPGATAGGEGGGAGVSPEVAKYVDIILVVLIVVLIVMVITLLIIANIMTNYLKEKRELTAEESELVNQKMDLGKVFRSPWVQGLVIAVFVVTLLKVTLDQALAVGMQQGYQPRQPVSFSHKLHAGEHQIDCNYCHTSVYKSKNANIPPVNVCMNCHNQIKKESPEIAKIYRAVEQNKPIEWVRIHNLPDLAYFNHAQHTNVGGIACQTCHGPIEEMDVVYQYSPLTMGWCINCHKDTPLNTQGNGYYDNLVKIHQNSSNYPFTVASNGGMECSKCHY